MWIYVFNQIIIYVLFGFTYLVDYLSLGTTWTWSTNHEFPSQSAHGEQINQMNKKGRFVRYITWLRSHFNSQHPPYSLGIYMIHVM